MKKTTHTSRPARAGQPSDQPLEGFAYSRGQFQDLVDQALAHARRLGATDAGAEASEGCGLSVSVRKGALETVERNRDKSLGVTVYLGQQRGNASTSDFSKAAIERTVQAAYDASPPRIRRRACPMRMTSPTSIRIWICSIPGA
jgi:PmbA protein